MKLQVFWLTVFVILSLGCTINLQIDTDYASQNGGGGTIEEEVSTTATTTPTVDVQAEVSEL